jgi:hypothetical protein
MENSDISGSKASMIKQMREKEKAQKLARKLKQLPFKSDVNIFDVFRVLNSAHQVGVTNIVEGVLQFLDTCSIINLSSTCKLLQSDIKESRIMILPIHYNTRINKIYEIEEKKNKIKEKKIKDNENLFEYIRQKTLEKICKQLIHFNQFQPDKYESTKKHLFAMWKNEYNSTLYFDIRNKRLIATNRNNDEGYVPYYGD